jgi:hypothetical protein
MSAPPKYGQPPSQRRARRAVQDLILSKSCGACQACCTVVAVHEIDKPEYQKCEHQCSTGCAIYRQRPVTCRDYYCFWRMTGLPEGEDYRPDNLRAIFDAESFTTHQVKNLEDVRRSAPYIRCWQLDGPHQILIDPRIRMVAYNLAIEHQYPVIAYYQGYRSVHLIRSLASWRQAFQRHPHLGRYPVYDLTAEVIHGFIRT